MTDFHEVQFPTSISRGSTGGPERRTDVVSLRSGFEERNTIWANSRRKYDASLGLRSINDLHAVIEFFEARRGKLYGFRWMDWSDYKSCPPGSTAAASDQVIGTGDGVEDTFQLVKTYSSGGYSWVRTINKPVAGTVLASVGGTPTTAFTVDAATGLVTFTSPPANGATVRAGFHFDVPVRFDTDYLAISVDAFEAGSVPGIDIVEVRPRS